jgi:hypothetical protein
MYHFTKKYFIKHYYYQSYIIYKNVFHGIVAMTDNDKIWLCVFYLDLNVLSRPFKLFQISINK